MIEINLIKEGHGFLYSPYPNGFSWIKKILYLAGVLGIVFFFFQYKNLTAVKKKAHTRSATNKDNRSDAQKKPPALIVKKKSLKKSESLINTQITTPKPPKKLSPEKNIDKTPKKDDTKIILPDIKTEQKDRFKLIAGTCLLPGSAKNIIAELKKNGFKNSFIEKSIVKINVYMVWIGKFVNSNQVDSIYEDAGNTIMLETRQTDNSYVVTTSPVLFLKDAKNIQDRLQKRGLFGKILKVKRDKEAYIVVANIFEEHKKALLSKIALKKTGIDATIATVTK